MTVRIPNFTTYMPSSVHRVQSISLDSGLWDVISKPNYGLTESEDHLAPSGATRTGATSDGSDLIETGTGNWSNADSIDGGGGIDTIRGFFPGLGDSLFAPTVSNVERAELMTSGNGTIDLSHWTGLQYLELDGSLTWKNFDAWLGVDNIAHETTALAVNDFVGRDVFFSFADAAHDDWRLPPQHRSYEAPVPLNQTEDLYLSNVGAPGRGTTLWGLDILKQLNIHASGNDNVSIDVPSHVVIDGTGNLTLGIGAMYEHPVTLDASHATGNLHFVDHGILGPETITLGSGRDIYEVSKDVLDFYGHLTTIKSFHVGQDQLDLHNNNVLFDPHAAGHWDHYTTYQEAAVEVAKQNPHTGGETVDVFEWNGSTYIFANAGHDPAYHDFFIKLENVTHIGAHEFAGLQPDFGQHEVPSHGFFG